MFEFVVNGNKVSTSEDKKLITFLREDLNLTSVKNGCSEGACGTCMVLVDGQAKKACILKTSKLVDKNIITVEGLSGREKDVYGYAFMESGAVQCGFCTPGMVISAKGLIDKVEDPTEDEIKNALKNNICRCTGYAKIIDAVKLAAKVIRENIQVSVCSCKGLVGEKLNRIDAVDKVLGKAEYVDDIRIDGLTYGGAVRTKYPRALVKSIDISEAKKLQGVYAVITADELPGNQKIGHIVKDWDVLIPVGSITHCIGDAIVLISAETSEILEKAKSLVKIDFEELTPVTCPEEALKANAPQIHATGNILTTENLVFGNPDKYIKNSKYVITNKYSTPFTEHAFLETETSVALPDGNDGIIIYCADQGIYQTLKECSEALGIDQSKVRVISKIVGGGFGGKEDMSVQHHAAILAYLSKRPVKFALSRRESIMVHPKRHAMEIEMTTACDENGYLTAMKAIIIADTGAYASLGGPVLQRACTHAAGPYNYQNIDIVGKAVYTNNPPAGAFRGFGVTQSCFAIESNLNQLAVMAGVTPFEIRYRNAIRPGQILPNGQIADSSTSIVETLDAVREICMQNPKAGIACAIKNSGLGVGLPDVGRCKLIIKDGKVYIHTSAACIGQGLGTILTQIVCETLNISPDKVVHAAPDTLTCPNSGNTTASRQTLFTGEAAKRAARKLLDVLSYQTLENLEGQEFYGEFKGITDKMNSNKQNPVSHVAYGYATHVVLLNDEGKIEKVIAVHDVGTPINPKNIEGQIEGGVVMSLGYSLTEDYPLKNSVPTAKFGTLGLFKSTEIPKIESIILGRGNTNLAYGAKGIGEICSIPTPPAVAGAYYNYDGEFRTKLPLTNTPYSKKK
ncbi:selenium-dependent xanthine dehydrogenase [Clostridium bowmanii]|uniref:selenium-dependent xanthine dehydrogenase n=1 Tax=Clostridium bowmanii TaxID=132925 RepID=UPI001C0C80F4|nr:selenium-dependent xanthine dehydrogenase [Clostridium bowmanii]MBU3188879.1 selenium-dependent xanthine dehydrogenase [Clostridium bowmanii]MCA1073716.1 selenium-dependent xanthine dehydrogenase [Clostridium bowmanii]